MSPPRYRLVVEGELGPRYASAFDGMTLRAHDGETEITGPIIDQSHLQGLIERIASLGLTLHSLGVRDGQRDADVTSAWVEWVTWGCVHGDARAGSDCHGQ